MTLALRNSTGREQVDTLLQELLAQLELAFPTRICSYYLGGSTTDGTAVGHDRSPNASDVDLFVIFRCTVAEEEHTYFQHLVAEYQRTCPLQVDAHAYAADDLLLQTRREATQTSFLNALIRVAGVLLYGEDLRDQLPAVSFPRYVLDVIESGNFHLSIPRQRVALSYPLGTPLVFPLTYPDPTSEFYGYEVVPARPGAPEGTRVLVALTGWIATLLLALGTGQYAGQKSQCLRLCQEYLPNDQRVQLVAKIYQTCKDGWKYALPSEARERALLRQFCQDTLPLENDYLRLCRAFLLAQLRQGEVGEQQRAAGVLQSVVYRDEEMAAALAPLERSSDEGVRIAVGKALESLRHSSSSGNG